MEKRNYDVNFDKLNGLENSDSKRIKAYKKPKLTTYGDISELVLAMGGSGTDGSGFPPFSLT